MKTVVPFSDAMIFSFEFDTQKKKSEASLEWLMPLSKGLLK